jgi:hypothetical protein
MKNQFRLTVLAFLATQFTDKYEQFNKAFELYRKTEGKNQALEVKLNRVGYTDEFLEALLYDLQHLNGITDLELVERKNLNSTEASLEKIDVEFEKVEEASTEDNTEASTEATTEATVFTPNFEIEKKSILSHPGLINTIVGDFIEKMEKEYQEESTKVREEFPFLNDEKCPDVMYVVVGKRIATFKRYQELHAKLQQVESGELTLSEEEKLQLIQDTEKAYSENRALWEELNHFATTGEILGKHDLFRERQLSQEVEEMSKDELLKYIGSSATFFSRKNKELKTAEAKGTDTTKINLAIQEREFKLNLVNEKLGVGK